MHVLETDPARIRALLTTETRDCLPVTAALPLPLIDPSGTSHLCAVAYLNIARRADLQRLCASIQHTGDGDVTVAWRFLTGDQLPRQVARLDAAWTAPVPVSVQIAFDLLAHRPFLEVAACTGVIHCSFGGRPGQPLLSTIAVPVNPVELAVVLALTEPFAWASERNN